MKSYSPEEVAAEHLPDGWKDPVRWLKRRLAKGEIPGKRISRSTWRMTEADVEAWLMSRPERSTPTTNESEARPVTSIADGLSKRSRSRVAS